MMPAWVQWLVKTVEAQSGAGLGAEADRPVRAVFVGTSVGPDNESDRDRGSTVRAA